LVNLTLATFLKAEFGFFGVIVKTFTQTPLLKGDAKAVGLFFLVLKLKVKAGDFGFALKVSLPFFTN